MSKNKEDKSLLEVREWKEKYRLEDRNLTPVEYLKKLRIVTEKIKNKHNIHLQKVSSAN